jgi:hypothetical protein
MQDAGKFPPSAFRVAAQASMFRSVSPACDDSGIKQNAHPKHAV